MFTVIDHRGRLPVANIYYNTLSYTLHIILVMVLPWHFLQHECSHTRAAQTVMNTYYTVRNTYRLLLITQNLWRHAPTSIEEELPWNTLQLECSHTHAA